MGNNEQEKSSAVAPKVSTMNSLMTVARGLDVSLTCLFTGSPLPRVTWSKNSRELIRQGRVRETSETSLVASLELQGVSSDDDGLYVCRGWNLAGMASGNITLMVRGPPSKPANLMVNQTSPTTVHITWYPGYDGGSTAWFSVEYKPSPIQSNSSWTVVEAGTNTTLVLTRKQGWGSVVFRVWAMNKYGSSDPSHKFNLQGSRSANKEVDQVLPPHASPQTSGAVIGGAVGGVLLLVLVLLILLVLWRRRSAQKMRATLSSSPSVRYTSARPADEDASYSYVTVRQDYDVPGAASAVDGNLYDSLGKPINWEVPKRCLTIGKVIGKGHFGKVHRAVMKTKSGNRIVAVKMLKDNVDAVHMKDFLAELELMKSLAPHPNIVCLLGCCTKGDSSYIIVEYCSLGNLLDFLRKSQGNRIYSNLAGGSLTLTCRDLLSFMWQIARGMSYLASLKLVHRDLAARNILMDKGNVCKIADFGLARDIYQENQYLKTTEGELPLRWMAYESIFKGITTIESDVWSFGVLMWEIVTLGANPYPGMTREQLISNLHLGYRMPRPDYCSEELYAVIWECWQLDPTVRPTFSMLCRTLNRMLSAEKILIDLSTFDSEYVNSTNKDDGEKSPTTPLVSPNPTA
ncbi:fibroblast growth factor receptor 3-like isoform X2 [Nematostella vectensis]|uniref:fibroblast growth factor receptor 3-like isoform X2 n=1 Tax=Nematostella vectensis TaxID=45351 RepID=UPI0020770ABD|nr:fibroblast growth factor receptor 3-like isoform X2 [Nematostella vectensis]